MSWFDQLRPASYLGVPFAVLGGRIAVGRRNATHEYPYRDTVWIEDLGRAARRITMRGFVIGDDCIAQRDSLIAACEKQDGGQLVHPTLGTLQVSCISADFEEEADSGRVLEFTISFIESGTRIFPSVAPSTVTVVGSSALAADAAALASYVGRVDSALRYDVAVVRQAVADAGAWSIQAQRLVNDATNLYDLAGTLRGDFGRYFGGANFGFGNSTAVASSVDLSGLVALQAGRRAAVNAAAANLNASAAGLGATAAAETANAESAQALPAALLAACANPATAIRLLEQLAQFQASLDESSSPLGTAVTAMGGADGDLFRRAAVVAVARASSGYQPSSYDDAAALRTTVCALLDAEIEVAGDQAEDAVYAALRALRAAVSQDLTLRGANLSVMADFQAAQPLPAAWWAQRIYLDPTRVDELVKQVNPVHPLFMPGSFRALAS
jgi:prophage DNA circulation protein